MENKFIELDSSFDVHAATAEQLNVLDRQAQSGEWVINLSVADGIKMEFNLTCINFANHHKKIIINLNLTQPRSSIEVYVNCLGLDHSTTELVLNGNSLNTNTSGNLKLHVNGIIDSDHAKIFGLPNFNFVTNKVDATHGLVIGNINQRELNYLLSRGIDEKQAKYLLVAGKLFKVFNHLDDNIKNQYQQQIIEIWEGNDHA